jgi:hypothetical protein
MLSVIDAYKGKIDFEKLWKETRRKKKANEMQSPLMDMGT